MLRQKLERVMRRRAPGSQAPAAPEAAGTAGGVLLGEDPAPMTHEGARGGTLTDQQVNFFHTFGFLKLSGLFADDIDDVTAGFEEVFAHHQGLTLDDARALIGTPAAYNAPDVHRGGHRENIFDFVAKSPRLADLPRDPRVTGLATSLFGPAYELVGSDGNVYSCDTSWHSDVYAAPLDTFAVRLCFYLDPLDASSGAMRVLPGSNHYRSDYACTVRRDVRDPDGIVERFGQEPEDLPGYVIETEPGDVIALSFRTVHATFEGGPRRRLFCLNLQEVTTT